MFCEFKYPGLLNQLIISFGSLFERMIYVISCVLQRGSMHKTARYL
jgi:hypothetical protein